MILPSLLHSRDQSEMVLVNGGKYRNIKKPKLSPSNFEKLVSLPAFYIDRHEVIVRQYKQFDPKYNEKIFTKNKSCPNCPAMGINWDNANRYCSWVGKRLPTEIEWKIAARGSSGTYKWPWGNRFSPEYANILGNADGFDGPAPVSSLPPGTTIYGAVDMIGNVWEWVSDTTYLRKQDSTSPPSKILKGGSWRSKKKETTIDFQNIVPSNLKNPTFGFRCMKPRIP